MFKDYKLLPYFINEELFLLPEDRKQAEKSGSGASAVSASPEVNTAKPAENKTEAAGTVKKAEEPVKTTPKAPAVQPTAGDSKPRVNPNLIFGKNRKHLLILVEDHQNVVMERADGLLLKDILKALDFTFDDVAIVNICHCREVADWEEVKKIPFNTLFSFGISHPQLPFTQALAPYELEKSGERKFLMADKLSVLRTNRSRKIALWNLLKQIFV